MAKAIRWAPREKRRSIYSAVGNSFLKTLTEPITNADSILKKQARAPHAAGLIDQMLQLKVGDRVNSAELKARIAKRPVRTIKVEIATSGRDSRRCRIIDTGSGMTAAELDQKFGTYAEAKAKGERTRSLFGRGALDVLLHHAESTIYSVKCGMLSKCRIYWAEDSMIDVKDLGPATKRALRSHGLPAEILDHGTVVQFVLKPSAHVPTEEQIISRISSFYMLRLIAADPNTRVEIERTRSAGAHTDVLAYDFPLGIVSGRFDDTLNLGKLGDLPVSILVVRSDVALNYDPNNIDRRENGLLFVDDNDAVLDLTLLPEYDKSPYLKHVYGVVRVSGLRGVMESKLEDQDAEAILTVTRDGFERKHEITKKLFGLVERHVKDIFEHEETAQKKGNSARSKELDKRISDALKAINQFNAEETETASEDPSPKKETTSEPIFFAVESIRLYTGVVRRISAYVNLSRVKQGEIVLIESSRAEIKVEPESSAVTAKKGQTHQKIPVAVTCDARGVRGTITALSLDKDGEEVRAELRIDGVDDSPLFEPPEDVEFAQHRFSGDPNRSNTAALLVNLAAFSGMPEITSSLEKIEGNLTLADGKKSVVVKVTAAHMITDYNVARVLVPFRAAGWGQNAILRARAKRADDKFAAATCKLIFEHPGNDTFSNFHYEDLDRDVLGDVAGDKIYVNAGYSLHRKIFGATEDDFNRSLEQDPIAQARAVSVLVDTAVFHTATTRHREGGKKGLQINPDDPIGSLRGYLDESRFKLEPKVHEALVAKAAEANSRPKL
jgi:hypothetical protein